MYGYEVDAYNDRTSRIHTRPHIIAITQAIADLLAVVDPARFEKLFGAPMSAAQQLIDAKTLTIAKLMTIAPSGTVDPSPFLYNTTMYSLGGLITLALLAHLRMRPVDMKYLEPDVQQAMIAYNKQIGK